MSGEDTLLALAVRAARAGGGVLLERFGGPATGLDSKSSRTDLVSDADRAAEEAVVGLLRAERPDDGIEAEEGGEAGGSTGVRWVVDPLDGTINYLWGLPQWCVSVAAADRDGTRVGVVHDPCRGETFTAARGGGARLGGRPLWLGPGPPLAEALVATGFSYLPEERARQAALLPAVLPAVRDVRRLGAAALDLAWLAAGRYDGYYEAGLNPWDRAAGELIVREAGGLTRELPRDGGRPPLLVAARRELLAPLCELVRGGHGA